MALPSADTPLYNHTLPAIEDWLRTQGCTQNPQERSRWSVERPTWIAELELDTENIVVRYLKAGESGRDLQRAFPYSLSRKDLEDVIFAGP